MTRARSWNAKCGVAGPTSASMSSRVISVPEEMDIAKKRIARVGQMLRRRQAELMLLAIVVLWALNITVTKYALEHGFKPLAYATTRHGAACILFTWFTYGVERSFNEQRRDLVLIVLAAGVGIWLNQLSYVYSLTYTSASTVALIF